MSIHHIHFANLSTTVLDLAGESHINLFQNHMLPSVFSLMAQPKMHPGQRVIQTVSNCYSRLIE